jgi:hypothetical protein
MISNTRYNEEIILLSLLIFYYLKALVIFSSSSTYFVIMIVSSTLTNIQRMFAYECAKSLPDRIASKVYTEIVSIYHQSFVNIIRTSVQSGEFASSMKDLRIPSLSIFICLDQEKSWQIIADYFASIKWDLEDAEELLRIFMHSGKFVSFDLILAECFNDLLSGYISKSTFNELFQWIKSKAYLISSASLSIYDYLLSNLVQKA